MKIGGHEATEVVRPKDPEELARFLRESTGVVVPVGGATRLGLGGELDADRFSAVDLTGLDRIIEHAADDLTVTVEAGVRLSVLNAALAERGQWIPMDPLFPDVSTVGGLVATAAWGPLRPYGETPRRHLIGLSVMDGSGVLTRSGGRLVKNVAGYDLMKLHTGALGTLGILVEMSFRVQPRPEIEVLLSGSVSDPDRLAGFAAAIRKSDVEPAMFVVHRAVAGASSAGLDRDAPARSQQVPEPVDVHVGFLGFREDVAWKESALREIARAAGITFGERLEGGAAAERRARLFRPIPAGGLELRASLLPSKMFPFFDGADVKIICPGAYVEIHPLIGVLRFIIAPPNIPAPPAITALRRHAEDLGGHLIVECGPEIAAPDLDVWGSPGDGLTLIAGLKKALDPGRRFNPGRFAGGL